MTVHSMETVVPRSATNLEPDLVVLVEDDPALRNALTFAFETDEYAVRACADAESLLLSPIATRRYCLVVDEKLPGLSGLDLLVRLRDVGVSAPGILITTRPSANTRRRAAAASIEIVEKPLLGDALPKLVRAAFARESGVM
jgi:two-component system response regulator FixJ